METPSESNASDEVVELGASSGGASRPRAILSCTTCRDRKLRCDRGRPCNNCSKRHQTCRYYSFAQSGKNVPPRASTAKELNWRLQHLEDLLVVLNNQQDPVSDSKGPSSIQIEADDTRIRIEVPTVATSYSTPSGGPQRLEASDLQTGSLFTSKEGTTYVEAGHWQAILDDIHDVRDFLQQGETANVPSVAPYERVPSQGPALLFSGTPAITRSEVVAALPPRTCVDRLISRFFNSGEPNIMVVHAPTFQTEYEILWNNPDSVSMAWLGLLYAMLCLGNFFYVRTGQPLPDPLGNGRDALLDFQAKAAHCLRQSDYTKAGKYKLEALLVYLGTEYFVSSDAQLGVSVCLSIIIRLSMHMGYHRDSVSFANISLFEGEMRRRSWSLISQVERLTSFQMGIPSMINRSQCNTRPPHNYQDADIDENMTQLPIERSVSEKTILSYVIAKDGLMNAFGNIVDTVCGNTSPSYATVLDLDTALEKARASLPPSLQMQPMSTSFTDSAHVIMQRYNLELLYLKSRCVLHRQYMSQSTSDPRFAASRAICVDAARRTIRHQADIHSEGQPGGQLHQDRWYISSLTTGDFLLASMILCLELSRRVFERYGSASDIIAEESSKQIISELEQCRRIWLDSLMISHDAGRAANAIEAMLQRVDQTSRTSFVPSTPGAAAEGNCRLGVGAKQAQEDGKMQGFEDLLEADGFDWASWDRTILQNEENAQRVLVDMPPPDVALAPDNSTGTDRAVSYGRSWT